MSSLGDAKDLYIDDATSWDDYIEKFPSKCNVKIILVLLMGVHRLQISFPVHHFI